MRRILVLTSFILVVALIGLNGLSTSTIAQGKREIDLLPKLKDKHFSDGRRVVIDTLPSGEKIAAEITGGKFKNWFLIFADGSEAKGKVEARKHNAGSTGANSVTCFANFVNTTTTTHSDGTTSQTQTSTIVQIPCPSLGGLGGDNPHDTFPQTNSNSNSNSKGNAKP
jgi:hypothetical protein